MKSKLRLASVSAILLAIALNPSALPGQEPPAEPVDPREAAPPEAAADSDLNRADKALIAPPTDGASNAAAQAKAAFEAKFNEYKAALRDIEKLQVQFQDANPATRQKINTQLTGQIAHAQSLVNGMLEAAIEAILFVATEPVATERLHALFADDERETVEAALQSVIARYQGGAAQGLVADFAAGGVRISVTDHGHGVSPQLGENIFHPFVTTKRDGLGVGLAISRTIVQSYGGTLGYSENPAGGAIYREEGSAKRR